MFWRIALSLSPLIISSYYITTIITSNMFWSIALSLGSIWVINWVYRWNHPKCNGLLPPGSMGLPLLGETFSFFEKYHSFDLSPFLRTRMERYGPVFKTNILGQSIVVSTDPDLCHFIFQQEGRLVKSWYPYAFKQIFGRKNIGNMHGSMHKYLKNLVQSLVGVERLKVNYLPEVEMFATETLRSWADQDSVELKDEFAKMIFDLAAKKLIGYDSNKSKDNLRKHQNAFINGLLSFPINIPGTSYNKCMQGRRNAMKILKSMLEERHATPNRNKEDFFDHIIEELKNDKFHLTEDTALDLMFVLLFASYETTSSALTVAVKLISEHATVYDKLLQEHQEIISKRKNRDAGITWEEYRSMKFTSQVINETVRIANIAPVLFRKAAEDVKTKDGYTIPAGWGIMVCPSAIHMNPDIYEDPYTFNPWRWNGIEPYGGSKRFMAFGGGPRFCVGADFSKLQMTVFLHHLVTGYKWTVIKGGEIVRVPGLLFPNGLHIRITRKED